MTAYRWFLGLLLVLVSACLAISGSSEPVSSDNSGESLITAACKAAETKKSLVLLTFTASWCPWCVDMKKISEEKVMIEALKGFEMVELDVGKRVVVDGKKSYERYFELMKRFAEKVFIPQLIILDPQGKVVARLNPDEYEKKNPDGNDPEKLAGLLKKFQQKQK